MIPIKSHLTTQKSSSSEKHKNFSQIDHKSFQHYSIYNKGSISTFLLKVKRNQVTELEVKINKGRI